MKITSKHIQVLVEKTEEERKKSLADLKLYYQNNKTSMHEKLKIIYNLIFTTGKYDQDSINLNFVNFQNSKAEHLQKAIPNFLNLKTLKLWKARLGTEGMKIISTDLGKLVSLEVLSLEDNGFGPDGCMYLCKVLEKLEKLKELWLHINDIGTVGAGYLSKVIGNMTKLEKLGLDENGIKNKGALNIISEVKKLDKLKMIGLGYNFITEDACLNIVVLLSNLPLNKIVFSGNEISEKSHERMMTLFPRALIIF